MTERRYKTGDMHPRHNQTAFVGYDEHDHEIWTSVYEDSEAPYRLADLNAQRRSVGTRICARTSCTDTPGYPDAGQSQMERPGAQLHKSL